MQMTKNEIEIYNHIRSGGAGFIELPRGLIAVWGKEAVQFLDGMITNDMKTLEDGQQMLAAFPNAQGRLLAVVRILRQGDRFLIETEEATREKVFNNLFRFTFAGDFFVEDLSEQFAFFQLLGRSMAGQIEFRGERFPAFADFRGRGSGVFLPRTQLQEDFLEQTGAVMLPEALYETLRIESGIPKYGVDMDETTIVPELGLDGLISYTKGCYIGQEIIARIHFRGHVAKRLTGLVFEGSFDRSTFDASEMDAVQSMDGKNAGRITSVTFLPRLGKTIALGYVRYEFLAGGTKLATDSESVLVSELPFVEVGK